MIEGDAAVTDVYAGAVPAELVLACGIFGNVSDDDVKRTVGSMPSFCSRGATVIWTRHRRAPDLTPAVRGWFADAGFRERAFESPGSGSWAVGVHEYLFDPTRLVLGQILFRFVP